MIAIAVFILGVIIGLFFSACLIEAILRKGSGGSDE